MPRERFCARCGLWPQAIAEDELSLQLELMMESALQAGSDPLLSAEVWARGRFSAPPSILAHWALARFFLRLRRGVALYEAIPYRALHPAGV